MLRKLEQFGLLVIVAGGVVVFALALANNPALLDWVLPVIVGIGVVLWMFFDKPQRQQ
ncbi:MAG: hypothetical protein K8L97_10130 [Anaerolineae bacterium]|nr:hypothetical protein [Anaerolineae bacterium]